MEKLTTQDALVNIYPCKKHDFLYVIKKANDNSDEAWLPRVSKASMQKTIKTAGLYSISYRIYTNKAGFEAIYISSAKKIVTE